MRYKIVATALAFFASGLVATSPASAATQWCEGTVTNVLVGADGQVMVLPSFRNDWVQVCNVGASWKSISTTICNMWVAFLTTAAASGRGITVFYYDAPACSAMPIYSDSPAPGYINLHNS